MLIKSFALMEKNANEDIDSSYVMCEPIVHSITDSMSIVAIPDSMPAIPVEEAIGGDAMDASNGFNLVDSEMPTKLIDSFDGLPSYEQVKQQDSLMKKMSSIAVEERNASLNTLDDNLERIEGNAKNGSSHLSDALTDELEIYLKELKDENEKLKVELEKNNSFMKLQLKNLQEWQNKNKELVEDYKRIIDRSKELSDENLSLKEENRNLKEKMAESDTKSVQQIEELNKEIESLRLRCSQMANYQKFDISSEMKAQELTSGLVDSQLKLDAMMAELKNRDTMIARQQQQLQEAQARVQAKDDEVSALQRGMNEVNHKLDTLDAMKSQLTLFERDFKLEEMSKLAALKEVNELQEELDVLREAYNDIKEKVEKGEPVLDIKEDTKPVGKHHRRHRRSEKL